MNETRSGGANSRRATPAGTSRPRPVPPDPPMIAGIGPRIDEMTTKINRMRGRINEIDARIAHLARDGPASG
jgi:hypothetical protein